MKSRIDILQQEAIEAALKQNWKEAEKGNKLIIKEEPTNVDAFLSLGFAFLQQNKFELSASAYRKALRLDPGNTIARNNLDKIKILSKKGKAKRDNEEVLFNPNSFITIAGKTRNTSLINVGQADVIAHLKVGQMLKLYIKKRRVEVRTRQGEYVGTLPDDISKRLIFFLSASSQYNVYVNGVSKSNVEVFIKEEKKGKKVAHFVSFPKNIQENLKTIIASSDHQTDDQSSTQTDQLEEVVSPFDLEELETDLEEDKESFLTELSEDADGETEFEE